MVPQFPLEIILMAGLSVLAEQKGAGGGCVERRVHCWCPHHAEKLMYGR